MQKTSYGMRISDWSSDVCSSDLGTCDGLPRGGLHFGANLSSGAPSDARVFAALFLLPEYRWPAANRTFPGTAGRPTNRRRHGVCRSSFATIMSTKIGRAHV